MVYIIWSYTHVCIYIYCYDVYYLLYTYHIGVQCVIWYLKYRIYRRKQWISSHSPSDPVERGHNLPASRTLHPPRPEGIRWFPAGWSGYIWIYLDISGHILIYLDVWQLQKTFMCQVPGTARGTPEKNYKKHVESWRIYISAFSLSFLKEI